VRVLGFMTGTSLDAVDMAVLETDGEIIQALGPAGERRLTDCTRSLVLEATEAARVCPAGAPRPDIFTEAAQAVAQEHLEAGEAFLADHGLGWSDLDLIGMHGQTVLHERPQGGRSGRSIQLGDAAWLASRTGRRVAYDFRAADMAAGGEGAPLAPIYHLARLQASGLPAPAAVLNVGGVANITLAASDGGIAAFDTGPGNGMIDLLVQSRSAGCYDAEGALAAAGRVDEALLEQLLAHDYFAAAPPKSLDRYDFPLKPLDRLPLNDAAATLTAFTAAAVARGFEHLHETPQRLIVTGGGRRNPELMKALRRYVPAPLVSAEEAGWRGDSIEAEAFAYLAARTARGLPISFPATTGVPRPLTGGRIAEP
jgi:anhydro-N-acetylmuramic acid kinase